MLTRSTLMFLIAATALLYSCGAGKKIEDSQARIDGLEAKNAQQLNEIDALKKQVTDLNNRNNAITQEYSQYKTQCATTEAKYKEVKATLDELDEDLEKLQEKLETALEDFQSKGVDVYSKEGVLYVSMEDDLLYKSGSAKLGADGQKALGALANVLNDYPDLKVIVVGNTDNVQYKKGSDNWTLSTERANGVVRILRDSYKVDPTRLTAAGKGKYNPVADNETAEGRAKNRRTDIVLNPNFKKIWNSIDKD